jgi:hypothetical protein
MKLFKPKRYNFDTTEVEFLIDMDISDYDGGICFNDGFTTITASKFEAETLEFYIHELTEMSLFPLLRKMSRKWKHYVKFKNFDSAHVAHLLSRFAYPNKRCLFPDTNPRNVYKLLLRSLSKGELEIRIKMGENWNET